MQDFITALRTHLPHVDMLLGEDISEKYRHDWSAEPPGTPIAVVRPADTAEVSEVLRLCHELDQQVVVQGGLSGLCGGANPRTGELALSLEKLTGIEEVDGDAMTMTVRAGTPLQLIQQAADEAGFLFPLDLGARGSCNIGGNISTNAGGNQVLRFGMTRNLVLGIEAVMADGTVISAMNKMLKNNAGYDLKHLFIGTEGTLGIVTRAVLRLFPRAQSRSSALLALRNLEDVIKLMHLLSAGLGGALSTFEVMWESYYHFITDNVDLVTSPFSQRHEMYVLTEMEGSDEVQDREKFEDVLALAMQDDLVVDAVIAGSQRERERFWQIRDGVAEIGHLIRDGANFDVSVPISSMQDFLDEVKRDLERQFGDCLQLVFGHIADSNLHYICYTGDRKDIKTIYRIMYEAVGRYQGSVSAEHGVGVQKLDYLQYSRSEQELELMRRIKLALDPKGILNRSRVIKS